MAEEILPDTEHENIDRCRGREQYQKRIEEYYTSRGLSELEFLKSIVDLIQAATGVMDPWQQFYVQAAVSGRGVEWAQTRGYPHYHIVGLPCTICSRVGGMGVH